MGLIYMRISPSGGKYIGQTVLQEKERWHDHCLESSNENGKYYNTILNKAIRKYGKENFQVQILEDNIPNGELNEREIYWIDFYKTFYKENFHGYNMTRGGKGTVKFSDKELLSLWEKGYSLSQIKEELGESSIGQISTRLKSLGIEAKEIRKRGRRTYCISQEENEKIYQLWEQGLSIKEIYQETGHWTNTITRVLQEIYGVPSKEFKARGLMRIAIANKKRVYQYSLEEIFLQEWDSATDAGNSLKIDISGIRKCIRGKQKTCGGYKWKSEKI